MFEQDPRTINTLIAAVAGSISGLSMVPFEQMTKKRIALTLFVGITSATFIVPAIADVMGNESRQAVAAMTYTFSAGAHVLLPMIIKKFASKFGRALGERQ
jgi:hypothetical protein